MNCVDIAIFCTYLLVNSLRYDFNPNPHAESMAVKSNARQCLSPESHL
jgi:hypothetical protein